MITIAVDGATATLTLDNPERRNAISSAMWREIARFASGARAGSLRCVVIRGAGTAFSGGADLSEFGSSRTGETIRAYDDLVESTCRAIESLPVPTIAVLRGACAGAGNSLAASCDFRLACDDAYFIHPAARLGLGYDPRGIQRLAAVYGLRASRQLILFGKKVAAPEAFELGAIDKVVTATELESALASLIADASRSAPLTVLAAKAAIRACLPKIDPAAMQELVTLARAADDSADYAEGLAAFRERRDPDFKGR